MMVGNKNISGVLFDVALQTVVFENDIEYRHNYDLRLTNEMGQTFENRFSFLYYDMLDLSHTMFWQKVLENIYGMWFITTYTYGNFEDYCYDFGFDNQSDVDKKHHAECIRVGDALQGVLSKEWIRRIEVYFTLDGTI